MPYLQVCIKEAMRLQTAVVFLLERIVPTVGVVIGKATTRGVLVLE